MIDLAAIANDVNLPTNALYQSRDALIQHGKKIVDLVSGNVNAGGIEFPINILRQAMTDSVGKSQRYRPHPLGQELTREAVSRYYKDEGLSIPAEQILITPGTSFSYWYAFKVLAEAGDEILAPRPSYPLLDTIAKLCQVRLVPYVLREGTRWAIDLEGLESSITGRTRAIVLISPHNPTGSVATEQEVRGLVAIAARHHLPIISDEVFSPFLFNHDRLPRPAAGAAPLVLTLNGLSKMLALPGVKIGWMAVTGEPALVRKTIKALDVISDTFLPVNEMAQFAVPALLRRSTAFQARYRTEIARRWDLVVQTISQEPSISAVGPEGGFYITLALKNSGLDEEDVACRLMTKSKTLVHPGYFYDMDGRHLILSFVSRPEILRRALRSIIAECR